MKRRPCIRSITAFVLFLFVAISKAENKNLDIIYPANPEKTGKWEKLELGVDLPADIASEVNAFIEDRKGLNPFDPDQLSIVAVFVHEDEVSTARKIYGFYYEEFGRKPNGTGWEKKEKQYPFRIRFAPDRIGKWSCTVKIVKNKTEEIHQDKINFTCVESGSKGQIQLAHTNDARNRYLQFSESKDMFFPVGLNLVWSNLEGLKVSDHNLYGNWMDKLVKAKANYIQLSSLPFTYGIEQEKLNNYTERMPHAWEFDQLLELAEKDGIYVNLLTLIHDEFSVGKGWIHKNNHWTNNPYNAAKNGGLTNAKDPQDFFSDVACKNYFKKRIRYLIARFGYSNNLAVIELLSEVDNAIQGYHQKSAIGAGLQKAFKQWFGEMKAYIQEELGYKNKLVSVSFTQNHQADDINDGVFPLTDLVLLHFYGRDKQTNFKNRYLENVKRFKTNALTKYKPVIFDEMGANVFPSLDKCSDITFHNSLWATAFMGCFGTGQSWWWDNALLPAGFESNFLGISKFLEGENFSIKPFESFALTDNGAKFKSKTAYEIYGLQAADNEKLIGWVHSTSFYWANFKNQNPCIAKLIEEDNGYSKDASDNTTYKREYAKGKATGVPLSKPNVKLNFKLASSTEYIIIWYNTVTGEANGMTQTKTTSSSGKIKFDIPPIDPLTDPYGGFGFKVVKFSR